MSENVQILYIIGLCYVELIDGYRGVNHTFKVKNVNFHPWNEKK